MRGSMLARGGCSAGLSFPNATNTGSLPSASLYPVTSSGQTPATANADAGSIALGFTDNTGWAWSSTFVNVTTNGAILDGLWIQTGGIVVAANNVTIKNCYITTAGSLGTTVKLDNGSTGANAGPSNTVIQDCTLSGTDGTTHRAAQIVQDIHGNADGTIIKRCNWSFAEQGYTGANAAIYDCYMHDIGFQAGDHNEWINVEGGPDVGQSLLVQHCTILNRLGQTGAVYLASGFASAPSNCTITGNLLAGAQYTIYGGDAGTVPNRTDTGLGGSSNSVTVTDTAAAAGDLGATITNASNTGSIPPFTTITAVNAGVGYTLSAATTGGTLTSQNFVIHYTSNIVITNNAFSTMFFQTSGQTGTHTAYDQASIGNQWTGNYWYDGPSAGTAIGP